MGQLFRRKYGLCLAGILLWLGLSSVCLGQEKEEVPNLSLETFEAVWSRINESYYDPEFGGLDWQAIGEKYRPQAAETADREALRDILNSMLSELGQSHFGVMGPSSWIDLVEETPEEESTDDDDDGEEDSDSTETEPSKEESEHTDDTDQTQSEEIEETDKDSDKTNDQEKEEVDEDKDEPEGNSNQPYSGLHVRLADSRLIISQIDPGSPAEEAGLKAGQYIVRIDRHKLGKRLKKFKPSGFRLYGLIRELQSQLANLDGVEIEVEGRAGIRKTIQLKAKPYEGAMTQAILRMDPYPMEFHVETIGDLQCRITYIRFNIWMPELMPKLRAAVKAAAPANGIIFDVRNNPGGLGAMAGGVGGMLTDERFSLGTMIMREGKLPFNAFPQKKAFLGPVAILVDEMSASTSEIFAAGLQEHGRARVFGRPTPGAALPSVFIELPNGDRLQHAIANFLTPEGKSVEGDGVSPDVVVPLQSHKLLRGQDVPLLKAMKWIGRKNAEDSGS